MSRFVARSSLLAALFLTLFVPGIARAEEKAEPKPSTRDDICPLSQIRPGLKGYGLTVKAGTKIERFEVEVIDIMPNYLAKQDIILVKCLGEEFADHQIAQGMSGSPIYFHGKVAGALAYTWAWAKHPLAGITPIETMLAEGKRTLEGRPTGAEPATPLRRAGTDAASPQDMRPIGTPFAASGFSSRSRDSIRTSLEAAGLRVNGLSTVGAPSHSAKWVNLDAKLEPGSAIVVELLRGDVGIAALGTCTFVDGDTVYGFGHNFNGLGETLLPMNTGYVYTTVASRNISFKLGGALKQVGAIVQDRPSCIVGVKGKVAPMVPFDVTFRNAVTKREEDFHFEVTPNRLFMSRMVILALREAFERAETTLGSNTKRYKMTVKLKGLDEWAYEDVIAGFDGGFSRSLINLIDRPQNHSMQRAEFEWAKLEVEIEHTDRRASIRSVTASSDTVRPGEEVTLTVRLEKREAGTPVTETLKVRVPYDAVAGNYRIEVMGGDYVSADVASPIDIADYPALYAAFYKSTELVAVLATGRVDLDMNGRLLRNLPLSSIPRLARSPGGKDIRLRPVTEKVRMKVPYVVAGRNRVTVRVVR